MGTCCGKRPVVYVPDQMGNTSNAKQVVALKLKLWQMKRIDEAPALDITSSKMYRMRKDRARSPDSTGQTPTCH